MSFRLIHASGNQFDTDSHRRAMYPSAAAKGDVFTTGEANKDHTTLRGIAGFDSVIYSELGIAWRRTKFDLIQSGARLVMPGGKNGARGSSAKDKRRRGPNRYALVAVLQEKATGDPWIFATHHAVAKADTSAKWRRSLRAQGFTGTAAFVTAYRKRYPTAKVVLTGDWNTVSFVKFPGLTELLSPPTFGRLRYDRIHVSPGVRSSGLDKFNTVLDHDGLTVNLAAVGATPTPAPIPVPAPVPEATMLLTDLADVARSAGLKVVEESGWKTRGHGSFKSVQTVVCHHTAGPSTGNMPSLKVVTSGRAGLAGPLCNLGLGRDGTVYVVAAGVAYHAGVVGSTNWDNWHSIGIEAEATGTGSWPAAQMDAYARLCAALVKHYKLDVSDVKGHKEVATPKGRKIDPNFDMAAFRSKVAAVGSKPVAAPVNHVQTGRALIKAGRAQIVAGIAELRKAKTSKGDPRPAVQAQADAYEAANAAIGKAYTKGPDK